MPVVEFVIAAALVACVVGGLVFVLVLDRVGKPLELDAGVWWWSIVGIALIGVAIAWSTSAIF